MSQWDAWVHHAQTSAGINTDEKDAGIAFAGQDGAKWGGEKTWTNDETGQVVRICHDSKNWSSFSLGKMRFHVVGKYFYQATEDDGVIESKNMRAHESVEGMNFPVLHAFSGDGKFTVLCIHFGKMAIIVKHTPDVPDGAVNPIDYVPKLTSFYVKSKSLH